MSDKTGIQWTEATWNPVTGCTKVSQGCKHCYALRDWPRLSANPKTRYFGRSFTDVRCHEELLELPLRWNKPRRIFVNSMSDLFHEAVPEDFISKAWGMMSLSPRHTFQVLTKRPERMAEIVARLAKRHRPPDGSRWPLPNVWLGVSVEDQAAADERILHLLDAPAAVRFLSCEPLLGPIDLRHLQPDDPPTEIDALAGTHGVFRPHRGKCSRIDWVITGGESGPKARPMHPEWVRSLRDQCLAANVPFFFKQWGEWLPCEVEVEADGYSRVYALDGCGDLVREGPYSIETEHGHEFARAGKKAAGRLLDGREWNEYPC